MILKAARASASRLEPAAESPFAVQRKRSAAPEASQRTGRSLALDGCLHQQLALLAC